MDGKNDQQRGNAGSRLQKEANSNNQETTDHVSWLHNPEKPAGARALDRKTVFRETEN